MAPFPAPNNRLAPRAHELPGPSRRIVVEPLRQPAPSPAPRPDPAPEREPEPRQPEPAREPAPKEPAPA